MRAYSKIIHLLSTVAMLLLLSHGEASAQRREHRFQILFENNEYSIDSSYLTNPQGLLRIDSLFKDLDIKNIESILINSTTSPEGRVSLNRKLSINRTKSARAYLQNNFSIPDSLIHTTSGGIGWDELLVLIEQHDVPYKNEVKEIIKNTPEETWRRIKPTDRWLSLVDSRNKRLMDLRGGVPYRYMMKHIYPLIRQATIVTIIYKPLEQLL